MILKVSNTTRCPKWLLGAEYTWDLNSPVVNTQGVLTPSGKYIGETWLPVVDFLVYFEQVSEQVYKKVPGDERPGSQDSPMY
jgi:hypothetical protein